MHRLKLLIIAIGVFSSGLACAEGEISGEPKRGMVIVEPVDVIETKAGDFDLRPYRERRTRWGGEFGAAYSTYEPVNFLPSYVEADFVDIYEKAATPTIELQLSVKRNLSFGSLAVDLAGSRYEATSNAEGAVGSKLSLTTARVGVTLAFDTIWPEPYVVPYASAGGYLINFEESAPEEEAVTGTSRIAPYANLGLKMQLDWLDRHASRVGYQEAGIENTFAFVEVRKLVGSSDAGDPDFSDVVSFAGGLRVEF